MLSNTCAGIKHPHIRAKNVRILAREGGMKEKDDGEDKEIGKVERKHFVRKEEEVQMVFVDSMHDVTEFEKVKAGVKYGKMD